MPNKSNKILISNENMIGQNLIKKEKKNHFLVLLTYIYLLFTFINIYLPIYLPIDNITYSLFQYIAIVILLLCITYECPAVQLKMGIIRLLR